MEEMQNKGEEIRVSIDTCCCTIVGTVFTPASAYRSRLSDLLNQRELTFLSVTDATVNRRGADEEEYTTPYLAVNIGNIDLIRPLD